MEEKNVLNNVLSLTKNMCEILFHGNIESSNKTVEKVFNNALNDYLTLQKEIFNLMKEKEYYTLEEVNESKIEKTRLKHENTNLC